MPESGSCNIIISVTLRETELGGAIGNTADIPICESRSDELLDALALFYSKLHTAIEMFQGFFYMFLASYLLPLLLRMSSRLLGQRAIRVSFFPEPLIFRKRGAMLDL